MEKLQSAGKTIAFIGQCSLKFVLSPASLDPFPPTLMMVHYSSDQGCVAGPQGEANWSGRAQWSCHAQHSTASTADREPDDTVLQVGGWGWMTLSCR